MDTYDSDKMLPLTTVTKIGLKTNKAATLTYVPIFPVNLIASAVWLVTEPKNNYFLRFHAVQSLVLGVGYGAMVLGVGIFSAICMFVPFLGHMIVGILGLGHVLALLAFIGVSGFLMYAGYNNRLVKLPVVGEVADRILARIDGK